MITLRYIQDNPGEVIERLAKKHFDAREIVGKIVEFTETRNQIQVQADKARAGMNALSRDIGALMRNGKKEEAERAKVQTAELKDLIRELEQQFADLDLQIRDLQVLLPNMPHESVPHGKSPEENVVVRTGGCKPVLGEGA